MDKTTFDEKFYAGRDKANDAFDRPEVYQKIMDDLDGQTAPEAQLPVTVSRRYAEQLVYSVLKEMFVYEDDQDSKA